MLLSNLIFERFKEKPTDASCASQALLVKGGYIKQVGTGIYTLSPIGKRVALKIENIIRKEMDAFGGQEVSFPVLMPRDLWEESGRYSAIGKEMFRLKDRNDRDMVLGMTHEEAAVHFVRTESDSYKRYPFMIYQIQTKLRDEPRPRAGLIRVREFTMKDAYSFHTSLKNLEEYYETTKDLYNRIFRNCGLKNFCMVQSDNGMMGGKIAHEFMSLCSIGEDTIAMCDKCKTAHNLEVAKTKIAPVTIIENKIKEVETINIKTLPELEKFFSVPLSHFCKCVVYGIAGSKEIVAVFIRGDYEVNETKLRNHLKKEVVLLSNTDEIDLCFGYIGAYNLNYENLTVVYDKSLENEKNLITGANKKNFHITGFSPVRDLKDAEFVDVHNVKEGDACSLCKGGHFKFHRGVEIGNIFQLGTKYTQSMQMSYLDENGKRQTPIMGCYGIGLGRIIACAVEEFHDDYGPIWPKQIAPWQVHICAIGNNEAMNKKANEIYESLTKKGYEVILDNRNVSAGIMFADADLIGTPLRIVFGNKNFAEGNAEITSRDKTLKEFCPFADIEKLVEKFWR